MDVMIDGDDNMVMAHHRTRTHVRTDNKS